MEKQKSIDRMPLGLVLIFGFLLCAYSILMWSILVGYVFYKDSDFGTYYSAGANVLEGTSIYSQKNYQTPLTALLFAPLALFPFKTAVIIWSAISIACFYISVWLILREFKIHLSGKQTIIFACFPFLWYPFLANIALGQISLFLSLIIIAGWVMLRRHRDVAGGILIGIACLLKVFPGIFVLYLIFRRRRSALYSMAATILAGFLFFSILLGYQDILVYILRIVPSDSKEYITFPVNISVQGIFGRLFTYGGWIFPVYNQPILASALTILTSIALLWVIVRQIRGLPDSLIHNDLVFSLCIIAFIFLSPLMWQHMLPVLILPLAIILSYLMRTPDPKTRLFLILAFLLFSLPDLEITRFFMAYYHPFRMPWYFAVIFLAPDIGLLIIWYLISKRLPQSSLYPLKEKIPGAL